MLKLVCIVMMVSAVAGAQDVVPPPVEEVLRQIPPDPHALDFVRAAPSTVPGFDSNSTGPPNRANSRSILGVRSRVTPPQAVKSPDPRYPKEARKRRIQGTVTLWVVVGADGLPQQIKVQRSLGYGLDEAAIEAVRKWRFKPALKDGTPVAVQINIEINFRL